MTTGTIVKIVYGAGPHPTDPNGWQEIAEPGLYLQSVQGRDGQLDEVLLADGKVLLCRPSRVQVRCFVDNPAYAVLKAELFPTL